MVRGKPWTVDEERRLRDMVEQRQSLGVIAGEFGKSLECVKKKMKRLDLKLEVVVPKKIVETTTTSSDSDGDKELPNVERQLRVMSSAIDALQHPGLDKTEVIRLRSIVQSVKTYKELLADYLDFRGLEIRLYELEAKYAELACAAKKTKGLQADK